MAGQEPTSFNLPPDLPYPITVRKLLVEPDAELVRGTRMLSYSFEYNSVTPTEEGQPPKRVKEVRYGEWECPTKGTLQRWLTRPGQVLSMGDAHAHPVVVLL